MIRLLAVALFLGCGIAACDPVHDQSVDALGGEAPGEHPGPFHRPGQPCLTCHDGALGDPSQFTVAGTIFVDAEHATPAVGAEVTVTGADEVAYKMVTNSAGNFYASARAFVPVFPLRAKVDYRGFPTAKMTSLIGRDGSCGDCHSDPSGPSSAGRIFVPADGVLP